MAALPAVIALLLQRSAQYSTAAKDFPDQFSFLSLSPMNLHLVSSRSSRDITNDRYDDLDEQLLRLERENHDM